MAAKWQQWMPFRIDAFRGSPAVQAMHPCARIGYLYLLADSWQTDDCTIPSDAMTLAEKSGLGDELWALHGPRILRKFDPVNGSGRLRNQVCFDEWNEAKRVFDLRRAAADRTNSARSPRHIQLQSPNGHRVGVLSEPLRSADTRTGTGTITETPTTPTIEPVMVGEDLEPEMVARSLGETLRLSIGYGPGSLNTAITEVARAEQKQGRSMKDLCVEMEAAYRFFEQEKPNLRAPWGLVKFFGEGHWRTPDTWPRKEKSRAEKISEWRAPSED